MQADFLGGRFYANAYLRQQQAVRTTGSFRREDFSRLKGMGWMKYTNGLRSRDERVSAFEARRAY